MRARDKRRAEVIRQIETEVATARSNPGFSGEVDDALYADVIAAYVKKMAKAREEFADAGERGADHVERLGYEIDYLSRWLPEQKGEDEARAIVADAIAELGVDDPKMAGRVVGHVMKAGHEGLDGSMVNRLVREALGGE